jgi:glycosyltransferase involved in cell wall biosynthesis
MKISYAILTHNEGEYIANLLPYLIRNKRVEDEIVVVDDYSDDHLTKQTLEKYSDSIILKYRTFDGDHTQKNYLNSVCTGDYILQLDADESVSVEFIEYLHELIQANNEVDLFVMPRINTVENLTKEWIEKWGWRINHLGWVNYPDWQMRLYKNCSYIKWEGLLHSRIIGARNIAYFPEEELYSIIHHKKLDRQIEQNNLYTKIEQNGKKKYKV